MDAPTVIQFVSTKLNPDGDKVRLTLPGVDLVEEDDELVVGADLSPAAARELACHLICWAGDIDDRKAQEEDDNDAADA